ncbi:hypothetical protein [Chondrinema litorale]|uniref:hypothetical protein n=1 Tax=Chondrinema litorale TaxID=2994555 RepID=UPI0025431400|nr:hypothetical protein [Chondrinema litorale]UZS00289.1 hypothetical protein OQ292_40825 [Chondrinema litorale]
MPYITQKITKCKECPFCKIDISSSDGFSQEYSLTCKKSDKAITRYTEWYEVDKVVPPEWCELEK